MGATINLDGVDAWSAGAVLPPGWHDVRIETAEDEESNGHPVIALQMSAVGGEHAGFGVRDWIHVTAKSLGKVRQFLEAAKVEIPSGDFELPTSKLVGRTTRVLVAEEPKNSDPTKMVSVVKAYVLAEGKAPASSGAVPKADQDIPF